MCKKIQIFCFSLFLTILSSFLLSSGVFAVSYFDDTFSNLDNWEVLSNGFTGSWSVDNNTLVGSVGKQENSFILLKNFEFGKNFELAYEAKNNVGIDQELLFRVDKDIPEFYVINTRFYEPKWSQDSANEVVVWKCFSFEKNSCSEVVRNKNLGFILNKGQFYNFKLVVNVNKIVFSIDNNEVINQMFDDDYVGGVGFWNWGGDFRDGVSNVYKNFSIVSYDYNFPTPIETPTPTITQTPTETPTPTAIPTEIPRKKKIFILPGLGASWNSKAIVYGQQVSDSDWKMTPFVNNYDGITELMDLNGLEKDKDYFVWNYDWRKSMADIKTDFDEYIRGKNLSDGDDVYLIGHSLGGVVARLWAQDNSGSSNIKKVIALGSPNLGSVDAYSVWNGGKVLKNNGLSSVVFNIILGLQNKGFVLTDLDKVRNYAPVVRDLLPVFDYASKNKKIVSWNLLESHNDFLKNENSKLSGVGDKLKFSVGLGISTPAILNLGERSFISKSLGLWPDGELLNYSYSNGDGIVLKKSSGMDLANFFEVNSDHGSVPFKSIEMIASEIDLEKRNILSSYSDNFSDSLVIFVGSPVTSWLKCGSEIYQENGGFIVAKNKNYSECELNLSPTDNGTVHMVLGNTKTNEWNYFEDEVNLGSPEKIKIDYKKAGIKIDIGNKQILKDQIKSDLEKLGLIKTVVFLNKNDLSRVIWDVFEYRGRNNERLISQRVLDNLFIYGSIISPDKIRGNYTWLDMYINLLENTLNLKSKRKNISQKSGASLVQLKNLESNINQMIKDKKYPNYPIVGMFVAGYGAESLKD